eukprot:3792312-Pyramimonas_sp.AAC.1
MRPATESSSLPWRTTTPPPWAQIAACVPRPSSGAEQGAAAAPAPRLLFWHASAATASSAREHSGLRTSARARSADDQSSSSM